MRILSSVVAPLGASLVLAALLAGPAGADEATKVTLETVDGSVSGELRGVSLAPPEFRLADRTLPLRDVLAVRLSDPIGFRGEIELNLADGGRLFGRVGKGGNESKISFNGHLFPDGVLVSVEWIRAMQHRGLRRTDAELEDEERMESHPDHDLLATREGAMFRGIVEAITEDGVRFEEEKLGPMGMVAWEKIRGVAIAPLGPPPALPEGSPEVHVTGVDGSQILGRLVSLDPVTGALEMKSAILGDIRLEFRHINTVEFRLGRVAYLSQRDPIRVQESCPYISEELFASHFGWQRDRSVLEHRPLRIGSRTFARGIGVHSESHLTFAIEPGDRRFQSWIGIDVTGHPKGKLSKAGSAVFKVRLDGREIFQSGNVGWQDAPRRIDVDVHSGKELELIVEMGEAFHILDRADWGDARILRD